MDIKNTEQKKCIYCGEEIPAGAGRCPYCGSLLEVNVDEQPVIEEKGPFIDNAADMAGDEPGKTEDVSKSDVQVPTGNAIHHPWVTPVNNYKKPLGNGLKVFLTVLFTVVPGIGQLAGIITAIVFMNTEDDADRKSFGVALLVASLVMFALSCLTCFIVFLVYGFSINQAF